MPIAFFTRTQTGALDQPPEQRRDRRAERASPARSASSCRTSSCSRTTLIAMLALEWRLTLLALLVLPLFIIPAKRVGRRLQTITREQMDLNAAMNTQMTERFNVSRRACSSSCSAATTRESGDVLGPRRVAVRDIGHRARRCTAGCSSSPSASSAPSAPRRSTASAPSSSSPATITLGTLVALAAFVGAHLPAAHRAHQRPGRPHDGARVVRAGLRGARRAERHRRRRPGAVDLDRPGRARRVRRRQRSATRPARPMSIASLEVGGAQLDGSVPDLDGSPGVEVLHHVSAVVEPGELVALVGPSGAGKTTLASLVPRLYDVTGGAVRVDGHDVRDLTQRLAARARSASSPGPAPVPRVHRRQPALRQARRHPRRARGRLPGRADPRRHRRAARRLRHGRRRARLPPVGRREAAARHRPHAAQGPGDRDPRRGDQPPRLRERGARAGGARRGAPRAHLDRDRPPAVDDHERRPDPGARRRPIVERGTHDQLLAAGGLYADLYHTLVRDQPSPTLLVERPTG